MQIEIRTAKIEDSAGLKILLAQLGYDRPLEWLKQKLESYLNNDMHEVLVAEDNGNLIGFIAIVLYESFVLNRCMHIDTLVIDENARGKGVGTKLVEAAENFAKDNDCNFIELLTQNKRRKDGTHNFYEKLGHQDQDKTELTYFSKMLKEIL